MTEQTKSEQGKPMAGPATEELPAWQLVRRERIVKAALHALEEQENERIQMRDVAASAGVALGTLYRYFSSKEYLYAAVLGEWGAFGRPRAGRSKVEATVRIRRRVHSLIRAAQQQPQFFKVYVALQGSGDVNARQLIAEFAQSAQDSLAGEFDMLEPDEAQDISIMIWSIINSMVTQTVYEGGSMVRVRGVVDRLLDLLEPRISGP